MKIEKNNINLLESADWFDALFYISNNEDLEKAGVAPIEHYLTHGINEGRQPSKRITLPFCEAIKQIPTLEKKLEFFSLHNNFFAPEENNKNKFLAEFKTQEFYKSIKQDKKYNSNITPYIDCKWYAEYYGVPLQKVPQHCIQIGQPLMLPTCEILIGKTISIAKELGKEDWLVKFCALNTRLQYLNYIDLTDVQKLFEMYTLDAPKWFDSRFYKKNNIDLQNADINLIEHYIRHGIDEGRQPSKIFSKTFCLEIKKIPNLEEKITFIKKHYSVLTSIKLDEAVVNTLKTHNFYDSLDDNTYQDNHSITPYIDVTWYSDYYGIPKAKVLTHCVEIAQPLALATCENMMGNSRQIANVLGKDWLIKFCSTASRLNFIDFFSLTDIQKCFEIYNSNLLDSVWYIENHPDLTKEINPLVHFALFGIKELRNPNALFDQAWYKSRYLLSGYQMPVIDYLNNWKTNFHSPSKLFNSQDYYSRYKESILEESFTPLAHYLTHKEDNKIHPIGETKKNSQVQFVEFLKNSELFLADWYLAVNEDLRGNDINPEEHYLVHGEAEGRRPNPYFDPIWYKDTYQIPIDENALIHYLTLGCCQSFSPSIDFDAMAYLHNHKLDNLGMEPLTHYLIKGKKEGLSLFKIEEHLDPILQEKPLVENPYLRSFVDNIPVQLSPKTTFFLEDTLNIHWVIPDFSAGAGGHMTIFRTIRFLELFGHNCTIWIYNPHMHNTPNDAYETLIRSFQLVKASVKFIEKDAAFYREEGDVIFATDWGSVNYVMSTPFFKRRFYFVQDYEPEFFAMGSMKLCAELSYQNDIDCICASPWLSQLVESKYNLWARHFFLAYDASIYNTNNITRETVRVVFRVAFYARHFTERRAVELGLLAFEILGKKGVNIELHCFGAPLQSTDAPFPIIDHGVLTPKELADIYKFCDLGIVFSTTNYSLIPQEMMACGLPICEIDTESTRTIFNDDIITFLSPNPRIMAHQIEALIFNYEIINKQAKNALTWVNQFDWEKSAKVVENSIIERLSSIGYQKKSRNIEEIKASIIIPTYNAGEQFKNVLSAIMAQRAPWEYELIIVDSGSKDQTLELIEQYPEIRLYHIDSSEFQHGKTRNYAISKSRGEFVAVLTHDALPADDFWLYNIVTLLEHYPDAAGAFGRHLAYEDASIFTKRDLKQHFANFDNYPINISKATDKEKYNSGDIAWQQLLHFYSDNNSCMRKSIWKKFPYPEVEFGEDQAWAKMIIDNGFEKLYAKDAVVFHSHDFDYEETMKRACEESEFFSSYFGYTLVEEGKEKDIIDGLNQHDSNYGKKHLLPDADIEYRLAINEARVLGFIQGQQKK